MDEAARALLLLYPPALPNIYTGALLNAGFKVGIVADPNPKFSHPLDPSATSAAFFACSALPSVSTECLLWALAKFEPTLVVPAGEAAYTAMTQALAAIEAYRRGAGSLPARLIEASSGRVERALRMSLPSHDWQQVSTLDRSRALAKLGSNRQLAVRVPPRVAVPLHLDEDALDQLEQEASQLGWPVVVKAASSSTGKDAAVAQGWRDLGDTVETVRNRVAAEIKHNSLSFAAGAASEAGALHIEPFLPGHTHVLSAVALRGRLLAAVAHVKLSADGPSGNSAASELVDDSTGEMRSTASKIVAAMNHSGFCAFHFRTGRDESLRYLVDFHLRLDVGSVLPCCEATDSSPRALPDALFAAVSNAAGRSLTPIAIKQLPSSSSLYFAHAVKALAAAAQNRSSSAAMYGPASRPVRLYGIPWRDPRALVEFRRAFGVSFNVASCSMWHGDGEDPAICRVAAQLVRPPHWRELEGRCVFSGQPCHVGERQVSGLGGGASTSPAHAARARDGCPARGGIAFLTMPGPLPRAQHPVRMNYYLYHAESSVHEPIEGYNFESPAHLENVNLGNLQGVLTYLHYEVIAYSKCWNPPEVTRKLGIDRITRFNVTSVATESVGRDRQAGVHNNQFAHFRNFDDGSASSPYAGGFSPSVGCGEPWYPGWGAYEGALFFSLPGRCPAQVWSKKTEECNRQEPGGECRLPDGSSSCTWRADPIGFVTLDELAGIADHGQLCRSQPRGRPLEYEPQMDGGRGVCFWNGKMDARRCAERASRLNELFKLKYPDVPADIPAPRCV